MKYKAYAATMQSVWFSEDEGISWSRLLTPTGGFYNEARVWAVHAHPARKGELLAGTDQGLYRYSEAFGCFQHIPSPMDGLQILKIAQDPINPDVIVCGTRPSEIYISEDNGDSWFRSPINGATECWFINTPRVTSIQFDPYQSDRLWVTIEIDGVYRSDDRGRSWTRVVNGLHDNDTHDLVFHQAGTQQLMLCSTEEGVHRSSDNGETWKQLDIPQTSFAYCRSLKQVSHNSPWVIASFGDKPSGETGVLLYSPDFGQTWHNSNIDSEVNSTIWSIGVNEANPDLMFAATIFGQIFKSTDAGKNWLKVKRELGEIRMIGWAPIEC